ncbi:hypothetical protein ACHAO7_011848 [Fusarium culmorum]
MATSVFHPFVRLPTELRLRIWETACFRPSYNPSDRRIQYVTVRNREVVSLPRNSRHSRGGRSAYLIDGGLWKACKESREVIAQDSHFYDWVRIQKEACDDRIYFHGCPADWAGGEESPHPAIIDTREGEEECSMLVYPSIDIFCIRTDDWVALGDHPNDLQLKMSFIRYNKDNGMSDLHELRVRNIALEFHRSWLVDIPVDYFGWNDENSMRAYFTYLLTAEDRSPGTFEGLWIIDKDAKWFDGYHKRPDTVYRDCDAEYIEVDWSNVVRYDTFDGVSEFMLCIDDWLLDSANLESCDRLSNPDFPGPKEVFRLLVRRDNQVEKPTRDDKAHYMGLGWCLLKDDYSDGYQDSHLDGASDVGSHQDEDED